MPVVGSQVRAISLWGPYAATVRYVHTPCVLDQSRGSRLLAVIHGPHVPYHANVPSGNQRDILFRVVPEPSWPDIVDKVLEGVNHTLPGTNHSISHAACSWPRILAAVQLAHDCRVRCYTLMHLNHGM